MCFSPRFVAYRRIRADFGAHKAEDARDRLEPERDTPWPIAKAEWPASITTNGNRLWPDCLKNPPFDVSSVNSCLIENTYQFDLDAQ